MRKDSVDYVLHLGDYLYEYPNGEYGWGQSIGSSSSHMYDQVLTIMMKAEFRYQTGSSIRCMITARGMPHIEPIWTYC